MKLFNCVRKHTVMTVVKTYMQIGRFAYNSRRIVRNILIETLKILYDTSCLTKEFYKVLIMYI